MHSDFYDGQNLEWAAFSYTPHFLQIIFQKIFLDYIKEEQPIMEKRWQPKGQEYWAWKGGIQIQDVGVGGIIRQPKQSLVVMFTPPFFSRVQWLRA